MSPTLAFILALLFMSTGLTVDMKIDKDAVKRMREREEFLRQEMTRLLQEINDNSSVMESLFLSVRQLLWLPWLTEAGQKANTEIEKREDQRMQEREEYLLQEMTQLLQEIEGNHSILESLFLSVQQLLQLPWLTEAVLLSLAFWLVRRWERGSASCRMARVKVSSKEKVKGA